MTAEVIYPLPADVTPLQFIMDHEEAYRAYWRTSMQKMHVLKQRMRNPNLQLYHRIKAASELLDLDNDLKENAALSGPQPVTKEPPAIIYRLPPLDPTYMLYRQATRFMNPKPPFEPFEGWVWC